MKIETVECDYRYGMKPGKVVTVDPHEALKALEEQAPEVLGEYVGLHSEEVISLTGKLINRQLDALNNHNFEKHPRPWGYYEILAEGPGYKVKRLVIDPGKRTSLQWHEKRDEVWVPVTRNYPWITPFEVEDMKYNFPLIHVEEGQYHRITNTEGTEPLIIIEVQTYDPADPSGEGDVHRVEDD